MPAVPILGSPNGSRVIVPNTSSDEDEMDRSPPPHWDRILTASQRNDAALIRRLVQQEGVNPSHSNRVGQSALHIASLWGHPESVQTLLELGASVEGRNQITGATPLHMAAQSSSKRGTLQEKLACIDLLLTYGADPSIGDFNSHLPLDYCDSSSEEGVIEGVEEMRIKLEPQKPALVVAVDEGDLEGVKALLKEDPSQAQSIRLTGDVTPVQFVIEQMMKEIEDEDDEDDDHVMELETQLLILKELLRYGSTPNLEAMTRHGRTNDWSMADPPLHQICLALRQLYARPPSSLSETEQRHLDLLQRAGRLLLTSKADVTGETQQLLHDAARRNRSEFAKYLIQDVGVSPSVVGRQGMTPLHFAARSGQLEMVKFLLEQLEDPQDVFLQDDRGKTARDAAQVNAKDDVVAILLAVEKEAQSHEST